MTATVDPERTGESVEDSVDEVIAEASPVEADDTNSTNEDVDRSGDSALEAGDSFTG